METQARRADQLSIRCGGISGSRLCTQCHRARTYRKRRRVRSVRHTNNDYRHDPESEVAKVWQRKIRAIILPNNRKVLTILDANRRHLSQPEANTLEAFRQHIDDLEAKHVGEGSGDVASRYPAAMSHILTEAGYG